MIDCKQASQLISKSLNRQLSWRERLEVRFHLFICKYCKRFSQQLITVRKALNRFADSIENNQDIRLPSEAKGRIASSIESGTD
ncbi:MAG: zf-HC2 domain-containing protein [Pseudomonadota bacterium]